MERIQSLLARFEAIKAKGLRIGVQDIHDSISLKDELSDTRIEKNSEYLENKNELDNKKAVRYEVLKAETTETTDSKGEKKYKNSYTDEGAKNKIKQEFQQDDKDMAIARATIEMLDSKIDIIQEYINCFKIQIK